MVAILTCGCTGPREFVHNGFKVGPNYCPPDASVAETWIDAADKRVRTDSEDLSQWWRVFNDPVLDAMRTAATMHYSYLRLVAPGTERE